MNLVILVGNLTRDPERQETSSGVAVCNFDVAVNRDYVNAEGERDADFFRVTVWREKAENCFKYLKKGSKVCVVGSQEQRSYEDNEGIKRYVTNVIADKVEFLTSKGNQTPVPGADKYDKPSEEQIKKGKKNQVDEITDEQLPFD